MLEKFKKLRVNIGWKSLILIAVCVALVLIDLVTKIFEERYGWKFVVIPKLIEVNSGYRNSGCAFSFLEDAAWGQTFLIVATFIMLALLIGLFTVLPERFLLLKIAVAMIVAGAIGNLIDRIAYRQVRDFVDLNMLFTSASCNFADFWIVIGTIVAIVDLLFINEWSVFPLTKSAKEAQAKRRAQEEAKKQGNVPSETKPVENNENSFDNNSGENEEKNE